MTIDPIQELRNAIKTAFTAVKTGWWDDDVQSGDPVADVVYLALKPLAIDLWRTEMHTVQRAVALFGVTRNDATRAVDTAPVPKLEAVAPLALSLASFQADATDYIQVTSLPGDRFEIGSRLPPFITEAIGHPLYNGLLPSVMRSQEILPDGNSAFCYVTGEVTRDDISRWSVEPLRIGGDDFRLVIPHPVPDVPGISGPGGALTDVRVESSVSGFGQSSLHDLLDGAIVKAVASFHKIGPSNPSSGGKGPSGPTP